MHPSTSYILLVSGHDDFDAPSGHSAICEGRPFSVQSSTPPHVHASLAQGLGVVQLVGAGESVNTSKHSNVRRRIAEPSLAKSQSSKGDANHDGFSVGTAALPIATGLVLGSSFASRTRVFATNAHRSSTTSVDSNILMETGLPTTASGEPHKDSTRKVAQNSILASAD